MSDQPCRIDRAFIRVEDGLVHLRRVDGNANARPLVLLHASPGSSRGLEALMTALAATPGAPPLIAPDMPGNGDSDAFAPDAPDIGWYADALIRLLDAIGLDRIDLYGTHTGARVACEVAAAHPDRIGRLIFDGIADYPDETRDLLLRDYAPEMTPDDYGTQFVWAFHFVRDQALHFPHFLRDPDHRLLSRAVPSATELHASVVEVLKGLTSYHKAYRAAFAYRAAERMRAIHAPAMLLSADNELPTLRAANAGFAAALNEGRVEVVSRAMPAKAAAIANFLRWT